MATDFLRGYFGCALLLGAILAGSFAREGAAQGLGEGLDQTAIAWMTSQGAEWTYEADAPAYGGGAIRSALNPDANSSAIWAEVDGPAQISFSWKTTSSAPNGFLIFFLDDLFYDEISGQTGWNRISFSIGAGAHTLYWSYLHDTAVAGDAGSAWLDHVEIQSLAASPDSIPVLLRVSPEINYPGQIIQINYAVRNNGQAAWNTTWVDGIYFSSDETLDSSDENLGLYYETRSVDAASSYTRQTTLALPRASPGPYYLILSADDFNFIAESVEDNNLLALPIVLSSLDQFPDLKPTLFSAPERARAGSDIEVSFTVENQGLVVAEGPWWDQIILSSDTLLDARDTLLSEETGPRSTSPGTSYTRNGLAALPALTPGAYTLFFLADAADNLWESDEENNILSRPLQITLEDPSPTPSPSPTATPGPTPPPWLDSDGDGISDACELARGTDPHNAASRPALGDFNGDGRVTAADAAARYRYARQHGPRAVSPSDPSGCDLDGNGVEDTADAIILYRWIIALPGYKVIPLQ